MPPIERFQQQGDSQNPLQVPGSFPRRLAPAEMVDQLTASLGISPGTAPLDTAKLVQPLAEAGVSFSSWRDFLHLLSIVRPEITSLQEIVEQYASFLDTGSSPAHQSMAQAFASHIRDQEGARAALQAVPDILEVSAKLSPRSIEQFRIALQETGARGIPALEILRAIRGAQRYVPELSVHTLPASVEAILSFPEANLLLSEFQAGTREAPSQAFRAAYSAILFLFGEYPDEYREFGELLETLAQAPEAGEAILGDADLQNLAHTIAHYNANGSEISTIIGSLHALADLKPDSPFRDRLIETTRISLARSASEGTNIDLLSAPLLQHVHQLSPTTPEAERLIDLLRTLSAELPPLTPAEETGKLRLLLCSVESLPAFSRLTDLLQRVGPDNEDFQALTQYLISKNTGPSWELSPLRTLLERPVTDAMLLMQIEYPDVGWSELYPENPANGAAATEPDIVNRKLLRQFGLLPHSLKLAINQSSLKEALIPVTCDILRQVEALTFHDATYSPATLRERIGAFIARGITESESPLILLRKLEALIQNRMFPDSEALELLISGELAVDQIRSLVHTRDPELALSRSRRISSSFLTDQVPYRGTSAPALRAQQEIFRTYRRVYDVSFGFDSLAYSARRPPGELAQLAEFGLAVARSVRVVTTTQRDVFPGSGYIISGIDPRLVFGERRSGVPRTDDPLRELKKRTLAWAEYELEDLIGTHFTFLRGMIAVSCPGNERYLLDGTHYSYVGYNHHFYPHGTETGMLVPTSILQEKLQGASVPFDEYRGSFQATQGKDLASVDLSAEGFFEAAERQRLNVLDLGWGSNLGGLANSYPPDSEPYFGWEESRRSHRVTQDLWNHLHKIYLVQGMMGSNYMGLVELQQAHKGVYEVSSALLNLFDLARLSLSYFEKGYTLNLQQDERVAFEPEKYIEAIPAGKRSIQASEYRMLEQAYRWYTGQQEGTVDPRECPIFCIADIFDFSSQPQSALWIDSSTMRASVDGVVIQLPRISGALPEEAARFWRETALPRLKTRTHVRQLHRDNVAADIFPPETTR